MDAEAGEPGGQVRAQHQVAVEVAAVLGPVGQGRVVREAAEPVAERGDGLVVAVRGEPVGAEDRQGRQRGDTGIPQDAVQQGEQDLGGVAVHAAGPKALARAPMVVITRARLPPRPPSP